MAGRKKCAYPMSKFYNFEDEVPNNERVSTLEDCEKCEAMNGCDENRHCIITQ